jgi:hypothetical protein
MSRSSSSEPSPSTRLRLTLARFAFGALALSGAACGVAIEQTPLSAPPRPLTPKSPEQVEVFTSGRPTKPYRDIALMQMEEASVYASKSEAEILRRLRAMAAQRGCDGLVVLGQSGNVQTSINGDYARTLRGLRATCIVYETPPPQQAAAPAPAPPRESAPASPASPPAPAEHDI